MTHLKISIGSCICIYSSLELAFVLFSVVNMLEDISIFTLGLCLSAGCCNKVPLGWIDPICVAHTHLLWKQREKVIVETR